MSSPVTAADRVRARLWPDSNGLCSSLDQSSLATILALLSAGSLVADSATTPFALVVAAIKTYVPAGAAKVSALATLADGLRREAQQ